MHLAVVRDHKGIKAAVFDELPGTEWRASLLDVESSRGSFGDRQGQEREADALAKEFVSLYEKSYPKAVSVLQIGLEDALTYLRFS